MKQSKPVIGLVGGIGAGKSTVAAMLGDMELAVHQSDQAVHEELLCDDVIATLKSWWGDDIAPENVIDRASVARIVFSDDQELHRLESLLYPRLAVRRDAFVEKKLRDSAVKAIVFDSPKLYEAGLDSECDVVICVDAERDIRLSRLGVSRSWSSDELDQRENSQISLDAKKAKADYIISNNSSTEVLKNQVVDVISRIMDRFDRSPRP